MPKLLNIITDPNPILRKKSEEIKISEINSSKFQTLLDDMWVTMKKKDGVGLAAPQIGKNIRVVVIEAEENKFIMINPIISKKSWAKEWGEEGCLSVPKTFGQVSRHKKINCIFYDQNGNKRKIEAKGMFARVIQHELDHLDGILFIDTAKNIKLEK